MGAKEDALKAALKAGKALREGNQAEADRHAADAVEARRKQLEQEGRSS